MGVQQRPYPAKNYHRSTYILHTSINMSEDNIHIMMLCCAHCAASQKWMTSNQTEELHGYAAISLNIVASDAANTRTRESIDHRSQHEEACKKRAAE